MVKNIVINDFIEIQKGFCNFLDEISALENRLGCTDGKIIGTGRSDYTQSSTEYNLNVNNNSFVLIDIPGIEGDEGKYKEAIKASLEKAHVIIYVNGSGKKAEKDTLEKIKNYMHDGTSVYAVFNVHCKAKLNRDLRIDPKTYREELLEAYSDHAKIVTQTEEELKSFLGSNFKGSICLNGLLSFCSLAVDRHGNTTIIEKEKDKDLRKEQTKFLKEYSGEYDQMRSDSRILGVQNIIEEKIEHFDEYILEENLKKLRTRLSDMLFEVTLLRDNEKVKIKNFLRDYDEFERRCGFARDDFFQAIRRIGRTEVADAFFQVQEELFCAVEEYGGEIDAEVIESIFSQHEEQIVTDIKEAINQSIESAIQEYRDSVEDAEKRLCQDLQREQMKFEIAMNNESVNLDLSFCDELRFSLKDAGLGLVNIVSFTISGLLAGSAFPGPGNIIGAAIGFLLGLGSTIWSFFASKAKRVNRAKGKIKRAFDAQIDDITDKVKREIKELNMESKIEETHSGIQCRIESQRKALHDVARVLDTVVMNLNNSYKKIQ